MKLLARIREDMVGVRFAVNVFFGTIIVWVVISFFSRANPIWAIASMIASSEPVFPQAIKMFRSRLINTAVGCTVGLAFVAVGDPTAWKLPFALALAVLLSSYVVRVKVMWRQAPITAALVIAGSLSANSNYAGLELGLRRVAEVILGSLVGLTVSWLMTRIWPIDEPLEAGKA